jgi:hypothetical protein
MYARVNSIFGKKDRVDAGISHVEGSDRAAVEATAGNRGLTTLVDREAGVIVAASYWDEPAHSSEASLTRAREGAVAAAEGDLVVESYEVAAVVRASAPAPGAVVRMVRVQLEPVRVGDGLAFLRDEVLPQVRSGAGFCGAEVLIDRSSGGGVFLTVWADEDSAAGVESVLGGLRDEAVERVGAKFPGTETYTLVNTSVSTG